MMFYFSIPNEISVERSSLCPVHTLSYFIDHMETMWPSGQLFICHSRKTQEAPLFKQRMMQWMMEVIIRYLPTCGPVSQPLPSCATLQRASFPYGPLQEVYITVIWESPCILSRFYKVNIPVAWVPGLLVPHVSVTYVIQVICTIHSG